MRPEDSRSGSAGLEAYALVKRYGAVTVLDRVSLTLRAGEILAVVGESGSGKSTLARLLLALETPTAGSVELDGAPLMRKTRADRRLLARTLGFVQQDAKSALDPHQSVGRAIAEPRQTKGLGILFITHDIAAAAGLADHLAVMRAGRIVEQHSWRGSAADFCDPYSRALFSAAHLL